MADIGFRLQEARRQRAMTLRQLSDATKIPLNVLETIERSDFSRLPGGIFARGHIRAYAQHVGLDAEALIGELRARGEPSEQDELLRMQSLLARESRLNSSHLSPVLVPVVLLAIVAIPAWRSDEPPSAADVPHSGPIVAVADPSERTDALPQAVPGAEPARVDQQTLRLELRPRGLCWVSASADGQLVVYQLMQPGDRATVDADEEIVLRVGDAGAFAYLINGVRGRHLGGSGQPVTLRITSGNYDALQEVPPLDDQATPDVQL